MSAAFPGEHQDETGQLSSASSQATAPMGGEAATCKQKIMKNVRWVTALTGLGLCVAAVFSFLSSLLSFSLSGVILCVYLCPIGIMISITETEKFFYARVIKYFPILRTHTGRGISYIFIAGLTISVGTIACFVVGFALLAEGIVSLIYHFNKDKDGEEGADMAALEAGQTEPSSSSSAYNASSAYSAPAPQYTPANDSYSGQKREAAPAAEPGSRSLPEVDSGADFGRQENSSFGAAVGSAAAAAAFDYATKNPEQAAKAASAAYGFAKENPELAKKAGHAAML